MPEALINRRKLSMSLRQIEGDATLSHDSTRHRNVGFTTLKNHTLLKPRERFEHVSQALITGKQVHFSTTISGGAAA